MDRKWKCESCWHETRWSYDDLAYRGCPVCPYCDDDMELLPPDGEDTIHTTSPEEIHDFIKAFEKLDFANNPTPITNSDNRLFVLRFYDVWEDIREVYKKVNPKENEWQDWIRFE